MTAAQSPKKMTRLSLKSGEYMRVLRAKRPRSKGASALTLVSSSGADSERSDTNDVSDASDINDIEDILVRPVKKSC
ncbi:hypothetical protein BGZ74_002669, partial [Mortierella antarctica]